MQPDSKYVAQTIIDIEKCRSRNGSDYEQYTVGQKYGPNAVEYMIGTCMVKDIVGRLIEVLGMNAEFELLNQTTAESAHE